MTPGGAVAAGNAPRVDTGQPGSGSRPEEGPDNSLQGNALRRAQLEEIPKTLTPWEWEHWYRERGMPPEFRRRDSTEPKKAGWLRRLLCRFKRPREHSNG